jgi:hypothetical protein
LFDKDGTIERLKNKVKVILDAGKKPIDEYQLGQLRFDAEDQLKYAESITVSDPTTANYILSNKIFALTELFFDIREISPEFYSLLQQFYQEKITTIEKQSLAKNIISIIFSK